MLPLEERWYRRLLLLALILGAVGGLSALVYDSVTGRGVSLFFGSPTSDPWTGRWWWIPLVSAGAVLVVYLRRRTRTSGPVPGAIAYARKGWVEPSTALQLAVISAISLVAGASQTGESLNTDGWSASVTNVVRAGDVLKIAGLTPLYRVTVDANSDALGAATIKINPPIPVGSSPADNAAITRTGCVIRAMIWDYNAPTGRPGQFISGLRVTFREAP